MCETEAYVVRDNLTNSEKARLRKIETAFRRAISDLYGPDRIAPVMEDALCRGLSTNAKVFHHLVTNDVSECSPTDRDAMRALAREICESDDLCRRNLAFSSKTRRRELEAEYLASLPQGAALDLHRTGELEKRKSEYIEQNLDRRTNA